MRRFLVVCVAAAVLGSAAPPASAAVRSGTIQGTGVVALTAKAFYNAGGPGTNGLVGWAFHVPGADGKPYTLTKNSSAVGNVDVWFFEDDGGKIGEICSPVVTSEDGTPLNSSSETGIACPGSQTAAWAVVVLFSGVNLPFTLVI